MERETGSIETGKKADFVIVNIDLMQAPEAQINKASVFTTFIGGVRVYGQ